MYTFFAIFLSAFLQIIAAVAALWLLKVAKGKLAWKLIAVAFILMAARRIIELFFYLHSDPGAYIILLNNWLGVAITVIMTFGVIYLGKVLYSYNKIEKARIESESRFKALFNNSSDEIFLADLKGNILEVNQEAINRMGYTRREMLDMSFRDIKSSKYKKDVDPNIDKIIKRGQLIYESEHVAKNGEVISLEMNSRIIDYDDKKAMLTIARDITERKQMERRILGAVINAEEKERGRLSKELHDGLGPILSAIKLYVSQLSSETDETERSDLIRVTNEIIDEAITNTRDISNNLRPRVIEEYGLVQAIQEFIRKINKTQKLDISFTTRSIPENLDKTIELIFYRIINELINNTIKHARASIAEINLEYTDYKLVLVYRDNGIGFDEQEIMTHDIEGMGLNNILSRIRSIDGKVKFESIPGEGMVFVAEVEWHQHT